MKPDAMWLTVSHRCMLQLLTIAVHLMKTIFFSLLFISMIFLNTLAYAEPGDIGKQEAVNIATQNHPGRVLAVKFKTNVYQIKILNDSGKVQVIKVDAASGNILSGPKSQR